jgi:hypothetical protein
MSRPLHDWEVEVVLGFFELLTQRVWHGGNTICWIPFKRKSFEVKSYHLVLSNHVRSTFPWKIIWKIKAPSGEVFFVWIVDFGKVLTLEFTIEECYCDAMVLYV